MPPPVTPLSSDEHRDLGRELLKTRARLIELGGMVASIYGEENAAALQFRKLNEALDRLCHDLEAQAREDCPGVNTGFYR